MSSPESEVGPLTIEQALEVAETAFGPLYDLMEREPVKGGIAFRVLAEEMRRLQNPAPTSRQHDWVFYMNGTFCRRCGVQIGSTADCVV